MADLSLAFALFLLINFALGLLRVQRGPTGADRMLAAQLLGSTGMAILLLLAEAQSSPTLRTVALVFALLATIAASTFVRTALEAARRD